MRADADARRNVRDARVVVDLSTKWTLMRDVQPIQSAFCVKRMRAGKLDCGRGEKNFMTDATCLRGGFILR